MVRGWLARAALAQAAMTNSEPCSARIIPKDKEDITLPIHQERPDHYPAIDSCHPANDKVLGESE